MKRILALVAAALAGTLAFADVELDLGYYGRPFESFNLNTASDDAEWDETLFGVYDDSTLSGSAKYVAPAGIRVSAGIFFSHPWIMDAGIDLGAGVHAVTAADYALTKDGTAVDLTDGLTTIGGGFFVRAGRAFRLNLAERHSLYVSPALVFEFDYIAQFDADLYATRVIALGLDFDIGYRFWISGTFGINAGVDLTVPLFGKVKYDKVKAEDKDKLLHAPLASGFGLGLYAGVSWKLGQ